MEAGTAKAKTGRKPLDSREFFLALAIRHLDREDGELSRAALAMVLKKHAAQIDPSVSDSTIERYAEQAIKLFRKLEELLGMPAA